MKYYVNAAATSVGDGSKAKPFKKIQSAAKIAMPGDEVMFRAMYIQRAFQTKFLENTILLQLW